MSVWATRALASPLEEASLHTTPSHPFKQPMLQHTLCQQLQRGTLQNQVDSQHTSLTLPSNFPPTPLTLLSHFSHTPLTPSGYGAGRGYPDISLVGSNYLTYIGGSQWLSSGTSASTPAIAAFFSNINAARIAMGKGSVGWINPTLYSKGASFVNDVTVGNNLCVATGTCCKQGFYATTGWDPATGLGSIDYTKLATTWVALGVSVSIPPSASPTLTPTRTPTRSPTGPTRAPTLIPTNPTFTPTVAPTLSVYPTPLPTWMPGAVNSTNALVTTSAQAGEWDTDKFS